MTSYIVLEKDAKLALSMKLGTSLAKALRDRSMQLRNGQFANRTCCTQERQLEVLMVRAAADDEHSNPITTIKPDVIVIKRADQGILMGEWIKRK